MSDASRRDFNFRPTSEAASHAQDGRRRPMWERVWAVHQAAREAGLAGLTDHALWLLIDRNAPDGTVRNRRVDLEHMGLLRPARDEHGAELTEPSPLTGSAMIVWRPTRLGPLSEAEWRAAAAGRPSNPRRGREAPPDAPVPSPEPTPPEVIAAARRLAHWADGQRRGGLIVVAPEWTDLDLITTHLTEGNTP